MIKIQSKTPLGEKLKTLINAERVKNPNVNLEEFTKAAGIKILTLTRYIKGQHMPTVKQIEAFARAFKIDPRELLALVEFPHKDKDV